MLSFKFYYWALTFVAIQSKSDILSSRAMRRHLFSNMSLSLEGDLEIRLKPQIKYTVFKLKMI